MFEAVAQTRKVNIAGFNTLRMLELWFQQDFFQRGDGEASGLSIRLGQLTADKEFIISDYGALFTNGSFGWPAFLYTNIPEGGPGYPMGTLGIRVAVNPWEWMTLQSAVRCAVYHQPWRHQDLNNAFVLGGGVSVNF